MGAEKQRSSEPPDPQLLVLLYHYVGPQGAALPSLTITPEIFDRQMRYIAENGYRVVSEADVIAFYVGGVALPPKPVLITFDDAYLDIVQYAFPVLRRYGFGALVFVVTDLFGKTNEWDAGRAPALALMNAEQIAEWSKLGISFGSHTGAHSDLLREAAQDLEREILRSADTLAAITGRPCDSFCFPWGRYSEAALACVRRGYRLAFTTENGKNDRQQDRHQLKRLMVQPGDSLLGFSLRLRLGNNPILNVRAWLAKVRANVVGQP